MALINPKVHMINSLRSGVPNYELLLGEIIDNSFDALAQKIKITISRESIVVADNGIGITEDRILAPFTLGDHAEMASTLLGRFGVGLTAQAINCADTLQIRSISKTGYVSAKAHWDEVQSLGEWRIDDPYFIRDKVGNTFTEVKLARLSKLPKGKFFDNKVEKAIERVRLMFHPALVDGRSISFNNTPISPHPDPKLKDEVDATVYVSPGKGAHIHAGILVDKTSPLFKVHVGYKHRVILPGKNFGCGDYEPSRSFFARVNLIGDWGLSKFKDEIDDDDSELLEDMICEKVKHLLEKCLSETLTSNIIEVKNALMDMLPDELVPVRPEKEKEPSEGKAPKRPRHEPDDDFNDEKSPPSESGPKRARRRPSGLYIFFDDTDSEYGIGRAETNNKRTTITLSKDNPDIKALLMNKDDERSKRMLLHHVLWLYFDHTVKNRDIFNTIPKMIADALSKKARAALEPKIAA